MRAGPYIRRYVGRIKERYPVLRKHPVLFWLLLPVILLLMKGITALGFGTFLVVISGFLDERFNIEVPKYIVAIVLGIFLILLIALIYRIFISKRREKKDAENEYHK